MYALRKSNSFMGQIYNPLGCTHLTLMLVNSTKEFFRV